MQRNPVKDCFESPLEVVPIVSGGFGGTKFKAYILELKSPLVDLGVGTRWRRCGMSKFHPKPLKGLSVLKDNNLSS